MLAFAFFEWTACGGPMRRCGCCAPAPACWHPEAFWSWKASPACRTGPPCRRASTADTEVHHQLFMDIVATSNAAAAITIGAIALVVCGRRRLAPFLWAGKRGGLFLADEAWADVYRGALREVLPADARLINAVSDKFLYGSRVLTMSWEAKQEDLEKLFRYGTVAADRAPG
mmetsp:Transcript_98907/g.284069  ORF Transcript_98907/g.284069 Transcript_98907/m.284069 type:complete len:172 (+) Transcript_98907:697-1212(+)